MQLLIVITVGKAFLKNNALKGEGIPIYQKKVRLCWWKEEEGLLMSIGLFLKKLLFINFKLIT